MATVVLGTQFGDEGKGKLTDILCATSQFCARSAGGDNAGHTIVANGITYDLHLLPSGLLNPKCMNLIGSGVVVHVPSFFKELDDLKNKGVNTDDRILISDRAQVLFDVHRLVDGLEEVELKERKVGTTGKGIGPCYSTRAARSGVRIAEIFHKETMDRKLKALAYGYNKRFGDLLNHDVDDEIRRFDDYRERLRPFVVDAVPLMQSAQKSGAKLLVEGANALMLDVDYGTYPYVTSSNTGIGGVFTGLALSPFHVKEIVGVVKAYTTRVGGYFTLLNTFPALTNDVGSGPFPTEQDNSEGERLQSRGHEFGVTTGRRRRCGWLDLVIVKYSTAVNHYTALNLTKLDILDDFAEIPVAIGYKTQDGQELESFPADLDLLSTTEPIYKTFPGWQTDTTGVKTYADLPEKARTYIEFLEEYIGVMVKYIGTGPQRENMIVR
ncbi:MAG: hypothetical protein M1833_003354 [Piccolia ochrophora]|nr:MAG: hypothetical protein M1833_003354 [Piccolia ochrophora]